MNRRPPHARDRQLRSPRRPAGRVIRDRNRKKTDYGAWVRIILVGLMTAQCMRVAFTSPRLRLQEVRITGTQQLSPEQVVRMAKVPVGQNIFRVNLVQVSKQLKSIPYVRDAVVTRELPSSLSVELREREAAFQVAAGGKLFHADREGVVFKTAEGLTSEMPRIQVPSSQAPRLGGRLEEGLVRAVWECDRLGRAERLAVRELRVDGKGELWLNVAARAAGEGDDGLLDVRLGRAAELPQKFRDIRYALAAWPDLASRADRLDVMCAGRPAYLRLSSQASTE